MSWRVVARAVEWRECILLVLPVIARGIWHIAFLQHVLKVLLVLLLVLLFAFQRVVGTAFRIHVGRVQNVQHEGWAPIWYGRGLSHSG